MMCSTVVRDHAGRFVPGWAGDLSESESCWLRDAVTDNMARRPSFAALAQMFQAKFNKACCANYVRWWKESSGLQDIRVDDDTLRELVEHLLRAGSTGCRDMVDRLRMECNVRVGKTRVLAMLKDLVPEDVESRAPGNFRRRCRQPYYAPYYMYSVHVDVNEKPLLILSLRWNAGVDGKT